MMPNVGPLEIGVLLIVALIVFGPKKLPDLGRSLGKGLREFKGSISGENDDEEKPEVAEQVAAPVASAPVVTSPAVAHTPEKTAA
jgi:sec-independent protein translocase protein TatA